MRGFAPMLSYNKPFDLEALRYPLAASAKYDGIRAVVLPRLGIVSRNLKAIPNRAVREWIKGLGAAAHWWDGELVCGEPTAPDCFNRTSSQVMSRDGGLDGVRLFVFDRVVSRAGFRARFAEVLMARLPRGVHIIDQTIVHGARQAAAYRDECLRTGFEGMMLRALDSPYKFGRSTLAEQGLLKVKLFQDSEAEVLGVEARRENRNPQERDALGRAKRSKRREGMVPLAELGGFHARDLRTGKVFDVAPGVLTQPQRARLWERRASLVGKVVKYRFQPAGAVEAPRFPRFVGFRSKIDF